MTATPWFFPINPNLSVVVALIERLQSNDRFDFIALMNDLIGGDCKTIVASILIILQC